MGTQSEKSFETARTWLRECLECKGDHAVGEERHELDSMSTPSRSSWRTMASLSAGGSPQDEISSYEGMEQLAAERPSRLIDLHPENVGPGVVKLVPSLSGSFQYMTLSYCWGKQTNPTWITTRENIQERQESFPSSELPATLFDALVIADRLGARYLWIDALCIVQDDVGEWEFEGGRMAGIYRGAALCIAASSATSSTSGILHKRSTSQLERFEGKLIRIDGTLTTRGANRTSERAKSSLYFYDESMHNGIDPLDQYIEHGPLSERAWALQERLLSPRILHYTRDQLVWQCEHCSVLEDRLPCLPGRNFTSYRFRHDVLRVLRRRRLDGGEVADLWYKQIVPAYSGRKLTYGSDKLVAVSALARAVSLNHPDEYLAGLWRRSLIEGMLWRRIGAGCKSGGYRAPSWSWASQDSGVCFIYDVLVHERRRKYDLEVIDSSVQTGGSNAMGQVSGGFIKLRARAMEGVVMKLLEAYGLDRHRLILWDDMRPFTLVAYMDNDDVMVKAVVCIYVGEGMGLLLQRSASDVGVYERVGATMCYGNGTKSIRDFERLFSSCPWRTITVR